jgi:hypothetical protein
VDNWVRRTFGWGVFCFLGVLAHNHDMKEPEYTEGPKALENFKRGMEALFRVPKTAVLAKEKQARKPATVRKNNDSDKD